ncbi:MAG: 30S ribosomal protein S2 [Minisyncoccia bacterium]|jgi:small subunit ribosomal protein S2
MIQDLPIEIFKPSIENKTAIKDMMEAGLFYGHNKTTNHPKALPYVLVSKHSFAILDLNKVIESVTKANDFIKSLYSQGEQILVVGTLASSKGAVEQFATKYDLPYVTERWLGGTLTNFKTIKDRITYYLDLEDKFKSGEVAKYTKKEQLKLEKKLQSLKGKFFGLRTLSKLPAAIIIIDPKIHMTALLEAMIMKVPVISLLDNDDNPELVNYPIVANDSARSSIEYIFAQLDKSLSGVKSGKIK